MRRGNPHSARSLSFYPYCHPSHLRNVALHHSGLPSPHRGMTTVPPPRLSADTAPKRRSSPDKLPHCLMQTAIARHVKFIRKLRIYIRNLRLYIRKFRLYIRNLRLYFAIGDSEVYVQCPGSLPALPAGLQTVTAGNMCIAGRVADRTAALARRGKKPGNGRMWVMPPAVLRAGIHGMDIMHRDTGLRQDDRQLPHGTTACLNSICGPCAQPILSRHRATGRW